MKRGQQQGQERLRLCRMMTDPGLTASTQCKAELSQQRNSAGDKQ